MFCKREREESKKKKKNRKSFNMLKIIQLKYLRNMVYLLKCWKWSRLITRGRSLETAELKNNGTSAGEGDHVCSAVCYVATIAFLSFISETTNHSVGFGQSVLPRLFSQHEVSVIQQILQLHFIQHMGLIESHRLRKSTILNLHNTHFEPTISHLLLSKLLSCN